MLNNIKKKKIIYLKNLIEKKKEIKKKMILKSIIQNKEKKELVFLLGKVFQNKLNNKYLKKNCLAGISEKSIDKKSKLCRFFIHKINNNNLNQNFKIYEK